MLTFKQFLDESLDKPYSFERKASSSRNLHRYSFKDHADRDYEVNIYHNNEDDDGKFDAEVDFSDDSGRLGITGRSGTGSGRILASVGEIMKHHAEKHNNLNNYKFSAIKKDFNNADGKDSRTSLYGRIARRFGGTATQGQSHDPFNNFEIPVKRN